ncbi:unnamed protein product [Microthlaspi erraticum]|uniref:Reverse transcriptase Ty1/copia-type domain-containing protein n=1 Tax=Microthlaspi erraticum TaxID=1685480 RepID=A0A6D2KW93_9BRAS|nr:unnamed protein product [Microthlaspi erraticum]
MGDFEQWRDDAEVFGETSTVVSENPAINAEIPAVESEPAENAENEETAENAESEEIAENEISATKIVETVEVALPLPVAEKEIEAAQDVSVKELGRGHREKQVSTRLKDFVLHTVHDKDDPLEVTVEFTDDINYPLSDYLDSSRFSQSHRALLAAITAGTEPTLFRDAVVYEVWCDAMKVEIGALELNKTWDLVKLPPGKRAIGCKWVYKIKYRSDGTIERYKARLVILGNNQQEGVDYTETFAPVIKITTIRVFLGVAAAKKWELHQMDVHNAFLHGDLEEEVYMKPPPGFRNDDPTLVCQLRKSLYGLKQAPRCWFAKLRDALKKYGFLQSYADYSLFSRTKGSSEMYVLVYVDDLIIGGNDSSAIAEFKKYLGQCFHMKDLGPLKYFLGIEVARNPEGIFLCQRKYTLDIIGEVGLLGAKPVAQPIGQQHKLALSDSPLLGSPEKYRRLVGRLIYLNATRPDLTYHVHVLSQFMQFPRFDHWDAALRVVRYLKGTPGQGILLSSACEMKLHGWCDSVWGGCPLTRRSISGWFVTLGDSPVSCKSKKQDIVSHSSAEAEYRCMSKTLDELKWLHQLLNSFGVKHDGPMDLHCDNQAALYIAANPVFHERTKHVEMDCHSVRDAVQDGTIVTRKVKTTDQLADVFTKALGCREFELIMSKLGTRNLHSTKFQLGGVLD